MSIITNLCQLYIKSIIIGIKSQEFLMIYIPIILMSYALGHISPAILITRLKKGIDIRDINSKNAGTSNVAISLGYKYALIVLAIDILKGFLPVLILKLLAPETPMLWFTAGFFAVIGHIFPVLYGFKGGKGTATFTGVMLAIAPLYTGIAIPIFFLIMYLTDFIAISTLVGIIVTPIYLLITGYALEPVSLFVVFSFISFYKHLENYRRILQGNEVGFKRHNLDKIQK